MEPAGLGSASSTVDPELQLQQASSHIATREREEVPGVA